MGMRLPSMQMLWNKLQANVFMVSYRGYGRSEGEPDEKGIKMDADAVITHLSARKDIDTKRIIVLGRSLGGAVGVYVASRCQSCMAASLRQAHSSPHLVGACVRLIRFPEKVQGLILENTFTSIADMVTKSCPATARCGVRAVPAAETGTRRKTPARDNSAVHPRCRAALCRRRAGLASRIVSCCTGLGF
jgi:alpha/beta superfamily hydrolase